MSAENNGGKTGYYDLPQIKDEDLINILKPLEEGMHSSSYVIHQLRLLFPNTLNDLIEFKNMAPWQHEVFKACYALNERALKGGASKEREINKIIYYANRGLNLEKKDG